jgi:hypothetical protein
MSASKRRFGRVRQLPSKRWQARYLGPDGVDRRAPETFATKREAETWLVNVEVEIRAGDWIDPSLGNITFAAFAESWLHDRVLKPRTAELYDGLLRNHLLPFSATGSSVRSAIPMCGAGAKSGLTSAQSRARNSAM